VILHEPRFEALGSLGKLRISTVVCGDALIRLLDVVALIENLPPKASFVVRWEPSSCPGNTLRAHHREESDRSSRIKRMNDPARQGTAVVAFWLLTRSRSRQIVFARGFGITSTRRTQIQISAPGASPLRTCSGKRCDIASQTT